MSRPGSFSRCCAAALPPIRFHDLRHNFATLQLAAGTNPKIVSEVLGHRDVAITLDRYSPAMPTMQAGAMGRLDAILGRSPLDVPEEISAVAPEERVPVADHLWLDHAAGAAAKRPRSRDKGSSAPNPGTTKPDPSSDRAENEESGTAYRIPSETSHVSQLRAPSTEKGA